MGFLKKLFGNVEKANKGEIPAEEIIPPFTNDLAEEADDYWRQMEQNLLINAVKAVGGPDKADRAFMLVNFKPGQETFDLYYQIDFLARIGSRTCRKNPPSTLASSPSCIPCSQ